MIPIKSNSINKRRCETVQFPQNKKIKQILPFVSEILSTEKTTQETIPNRFLPIQVLSSGINSTTGEYCTPFHLLYNDNLEEEETEDTEELEESESTNNMNLTEPSSITTEDFLSGIEQFIFLIKTYGQEQSDDDFLLGIYNFINTHRTLIAGSQNQEILNSLEALETLLTDRYSENKNLKKLTSSINSLIMTIFLPDEIQLHILSYLSENKDIINTKLINKYFSSLSNESKIHYLNANKVPLKNILGLDFNFTYEFLAEMGHSLKYLELDGKDYRDSEVIQILRHCPNINHLKLTNLSITEEMTAVLSSMQNLKTLFFNFNIFQGESFQDLADIIPRLENLSLRNCGTWHKPCLNDYNLEAFTSNLQKSHLQTLDLSHNIIDQKTVRGIANNLPESLQTLNLHDCGIGNKGAKAIAKMLPNSKLHTLDIGSNDITYNGAIAIAKSLPHCQLQKLILADNQLGDEVVVDLAFLLPESKLQTLDLSSNLISDIGVLAIVCGLPALLLQLDLSDNKIGPHGAKSIAIKLPTSKLHDLNLGFNDLKDEGASEIASVLPQSQLRTLTLSRNNITDAGIWDIAAMLTQCKLEILDLSCNAITDEGAYDIACNLPESNIKKLNLKQNQIYNSGAEAFADKLQESQLEMLHLGSNKIADLGAQLIIDALPKSKLKRLNISKNLLSDEFQSSKSSEKRVKIKI